MHIFAGQHQQPNIPGLGDSLGAVTQATGGPAPLTQAPSCTGISVSMWGCWYRLVLVPVPSIRPVLLLNTYTLDSIITVSWLSVVTFSGGLQVVSGHQLDPRVLVTPWTPAGNREESPRVPPPRSRTSPPPPL